MFIKWRIPQTIQWIIRLFLMFFALFTIQRIITYFSFHPQSYSIGELLPSFLLGIRYDIRWISAMLFPIVIFSFIPNFSPFSGNKSKKFWTNYLSIVTIIVLIMFGADFGHFAYVSTRLQSSALTLMSSVPDAKISMKMVWQSYPVIIILLGLIAVLIFFAWVFRKMYLNVAIKNSAEPINYIKRWYIIIAILMFIAFYGSLTIRPLYWSDAFKLKDNFKSYLALNPVQSFLTTLKFRRPEASEKMARNFYPTISNFLQFDSLQQTEFNYKRLVQPTSRGLESKPNVVLIICESFSMYKSSMSGNPLNATPYFNALTKQGIFFQNCFSPHFATARGVFSILTGTPDMQLNTFSSKVPESVKQHTIINSFEEYSKLYFLGGSSEYNNFRGLLDNIKGLKRFEEGSFKAKPINVWGINDKELFLEANEILAKETKPFFAIIQTSSNHRPYSIDPKDVDFEKKEIPKDSLLKYGFNSISEYYAFNYMDFNFKKFITAAQQQKYFDNTIFIFVGDHGVAGNCNALYPSCWTDQRLSDEHIPLLYFAPKLLEPQHHNEPISQIDLLPTLAGMVHMPYTNTTLGRDVLNPAKKGNYAFTIHHDEGKIGLVTDSFYFVKNIRFAQQNMYPLHFNQVMPTGYRKDSIMQHLNLLTTAYYETGKWMLVNNAE